MPPPPPLSLGQFAQQQIEIQGLSVKQFARRAGLGLSHAYQILRGKRPNASAETYEAVARGLGMTLSEMLVAIGRRTRSAADRLLSSTVATRRRSRCWRPGWVGAKRATTW